MEPGPLRRTCFSDQPKEQPMSQGPIQGPGTSPGGGQSGRPGVAGGTGGQKSFEQSSPDHDEGDTSRLNQEPDPADRRQTPK
jgi:hypothetical protein